MNGAPLGGFTPPPEGCAVALGFFDGVHRGHQAILEGARDLGREGGLRPIAFTFANHPTTVLAPGSVPPLLTTPEERLQLIRRAGLEAVWRDFDEDFSHTPAEEFLRRFLVGRLGCRAVSVGPNYRFGHRAAGDPALLQALAPDLGLEVRIASPVQSEEGRTISSSRIRHLLMDGQAARAAAWLSRPYRVEAPVERGASRGAGLGARTANLRIPAGKVQPATGVYAVWAGPEGRLAPGVANFGVRPTFGGGDPVLEVHFFDLEEDLYGRPLEVFLVDRLRPEIKFPDADALRAQIARDVESARRVLEAAEPPESLF